MTPNKRDLKAYSRFDGTGRIVPGSTVLRRNKPKNGNWKEVQAYECCVPSTCTEPLIIQARPNEGFYEFGFRVNTINSVRGTIDWGDGTTETFNLTNDPGYTYFGHNYLTADYIPQTVKVFFDSVAGFDNLEIGDEPWKVLSVSNISTVFAGSSIQQIDADQSLIVSLDVSGLTSLTDLYALDCPNLTYVNVQGCTSLQEIDLTNDALESLDLSGCTSLDSAYLWDNVSLTSILIDDCPNISFLDAQGCALIETNVNYILTTLDNNGLSGGFVDLRDGTNAAPTGGGLTAQANLISNGWTALTN